MEWPILIKLLGFTLPKKQSHSQKCFGHLIFVLIAWQAPTLKQSKFKRRELVVLQHTLNSPNELRGEGSKSFAFQNVVIKLLKYFNSQTQALKFTFTGTSQLTAHNVFQVTLTATNVCDRSLWKISPTKQYKNDRLWKKFHYNFTFSFIRLNLSCFWCAMGKF